jgi:acetyltransferase
VTIIIERIERDASDDVVRALASLLVDAVDGGAGVSFMAGLSLAEAASWWRQTLRASSPRAIILIARQAGEVAGTVQLQPAWAPNQPHRADIAKLIVHRKARRKGIARELMREVERLAKDAGFTLLLLDTCKGTAAERLYQSLGWTRVGEVPHFALNPDGTPCDTVFFYRQLSRADEWE